MGLSECIRLLFSRCFETHWRPLPAGPRFTPGSTRSSGRVIRGRGARRWQEMDYGAYSVATNLHVTARRGGTLAQPVAPYGRLDGDRLAGDLGWALVGDLGIRTAWVQ